MLFFIYFSLYRILNLLTDFSPLEAPITSMTLRMHNENFLVDIYV
jgi:hypothetical protein